MSDCLQSPILDDVAAYYSDKFVMHGETPQGVDWNSEDGQFLRFEKLTRVIDQPVFSLNDLGCGYGSFVQYLDRHYCGFDYHGFDVSPEMVQAGGRRYAGRREISFHLASAPDMVADFGVASGIFNVRLNYDDQEWLSHIVSVLDTLDRTSRRGFSFNCLTSYSDKDRKRADLYYADPAILFDLCKRRYSRHIALLHDYDLYEFSILVRKSS